MWLPLEHPLLGTWPATQACALTGNGTGDPLVCRPVLNPLRHNSQGPFLLILYPTSLERPSLLILIKAGPPSPVLLSQHTSEPLVNTYLLIYRLSLSLDYKLHQGRNSVLFIVTYPASNTQYLTKSTSNLVSSLEGMNEQMPIISFGSS